MRVEGERPLMWIKHLLLSLVGISAGFAVASGTFAFIIVLGIIPRLIGKSKTAGEIMYYENAVLLGGIGGNILSVFLDIRLPLGHIFLALYGLMAGIFVGCIAVALAENLKTFPIVFRRIRINEGLPIILSFMAIGKTIGALLYFYFHMAAQ